jgi:D-amino-acid dehydrogenase
VVGLTSAWWLAEAGFKVTLLERAAAVGTGASYRNGGQLSYRYVAPLADAGVPLKGLQWMFQKDGPLRFKLEADVRQWTWLARFLLNCTATANRRTTAQLLGLGELSRSAMGELEMTLPLNEFSWREAGKLVVYRSPKVFAAATARPESDEAQEILSAEQCAQREPALRAAQGQLAGGIFTHGEAVADCHAFCVALSQRLQAHANFQGVVQAEVERLLTHDGQIIGLQTSEGILQADRYVLAAGMQSRNLAATAHIRLPLYPLKGYSLTVPVGAGHVAPEISVTDFERKVLYARIGQNLRIAAMVDMVGEDDSIDPRRIESLTRIARETMPNAGDYAQAETWAGLRPATPNSAPIIGRTEYSNLWLNVGHGPLGFTFACGTASVLAALMQEKAAPIALDGLLYRP